MRVHVWLLSQKQPLAKMAALPKIMSLPEGTLFPVTSKHEDYKSLVLLKQLETSHELPIQIRNSLWDCLKCLLQKHMCSNSSSAQSCFHHPLIGFVPKSITEWPICKQPVSESFSYENKEPNVQQIINW